MRVTPSVSAEELRHYEQLRAQFSSHHPQAKPPSSGGGGGNGGGGSGEPAVLASSLLAKVAVRLSKEGNGGDEGAMEAVWSSLRQGQGQEEAEGSAGRV